MTRERKQRKAAASPQRPVEGRRAAAWRQQAPPARASRDNLAYVLVPALVVIALGLVGVWYIGSGQGGVPAATQTAPARAASSEQAAALSDVVWPTYVANGTSSVREAYEFAVQRPDVLKYMPCYCGCGREAGHQSNEDCFVQAMNQGGKTIAFDRHGSA